MKIETKFNIGEQFYLKNNRKAVLKKVHHIIINDNNRLMYNCYDHTGNNTYDYYAEDCFSTKEECNLAIIEEIAKETTGG